MSIDRITVGDEAIEVANLPVHIQEKVKAYEIAYDRYLDATRQVSIYNSAMQSLGDQISAEATSYLAQNQPAQPVATEQPTTGE